MATSPISDKPRHMFGPRAIAMILPPVVRPVLRKRAPAVAALLADWSAILGPALSAVTSPRKLFQGTLAIACSGPIAMELQHLAPTLIARINGHLGQVAVTRLRFVQDVTPKPPGPAIRRPNTIAATAAVASLPSGRLRDALLSLGEAVLSTPPPPKG